MSDNLPLVSVGLPIYNRPEGLRRTLESFINQTYTNIEIIIADNCSPNPEVEKIAREYLEKDARISYYRHDENKGWGYNGNFVIEKAKGEYFLRATDDDWWDATFIEKIIQLMIKDKSIVLGFSNFIAVDENGNKGNDYPDFYPLFKEFTVDSITKKAQNYIGQFEGFGKSNLYFSIFRLELLKSDFVRNNLLNQTLAGDLQINLFCLLRGKFVIHPEILFKVTFGNQKLYELNKVENKLIDLLFFTFDYKKFKSLKKNWKPYLFSLYSIVNDADISFVKKTFIFPTITKRIFLFYYDCVCMTIRLRGYNIFGKMKRKYCLE